MLSRLLHLVLKELRALLGTRSGIGMLIMPVLLQTAIFPFAATLEVKNNTLAVWNQDDGAASREIIQRLSHLPAFSQIIMLHDAAAVQQALDTQQALLVLEFGPDFSRRMLQQQSPSAALLLDGRRSNSGQIAASYVQQVMAAYLQERSGSAPAQLQVRNLYNPNLEFQWHVLPSLVAIISTIGCLVVTALSVAREREEGTFDQLLVSPLTPGWIMAGKALPGMLVALVQGSIIAAAAHFIYDVPFSGSAPVLLCGMLAYGLSLAGVGLFISSLSQTQQQAFLGVFAFMVPAVILSGYVSPLENMPWFLQKLAWINPLTYFIRILKGVFLKEFGFAEAAEFLWPMLAISCVTLGVALRMFRRHIA